MGATAAEYRRKRSTKTVVKAKRINNMSFLRRLWIWLSSFESRPPSQALESAELIVPINLNIWQNRTVGATAKINKQIESSSGTSGFVKHLVATTASHPMLDFRPQIWLSVAHCKENCPRDYIGSCREVENGEGILVSRCSARFT